jgi:hypothetical protein
MKPVDCQLTIMGPDRRIDLTHVTHWEAPLPLAIVPSSGMFSVEEEILSTQEFLDLINDSINIDNDASSTVYQYVSTDRGGTDVFRFLKCKFALLKRREGRCIIVFDFDSWSKIN